MISPRRGTLRKESQAGPPLPLRELEIAIDPEPDFDFDHTCIPGIQNSARTYFCKKLDCKILFLYFYLTLAINNKKIQFLR